MAHAADLGNPGAIDAQHDRAVERLVRHDAAVVLHERQDQRLRVGPVEERVMVPLDAGLAERARGPLRELLRLCEIAHVEQRHLGALHPPLRAGLLADTDHEVVADGVQVPRVAGDLQLAEDLGCRGVTEVDGVEGIGLAKRDEVRVDAFAATHVADPTDLGERVTGSFQRSDHALGLLLRVPRRALRRGHTQHTVVLAERELVEEMAGHRSGREIRGRLRAIDRELVHRRGEVALPIRESGGGRLLLGVDPCFGRDVEVRVGRVHGLAASEDRDGVAVGERLRRVEREHR